MSSSPNSLQKRIHRLFVLKPVSAFLSKALHHADAFMLRLTAERHTFTELVGLPISQLTMIGAKTGKPRSITLVCLPDGGRLVLIATNFGQRHNPSWYYNLKAHPECQVSNNGRTGTYIARETEGSEYQKYWQLALSYYAGYDKYKQRAAHRHIPGMLLEPKK